MTTCRAYFSVQLITICAVVKSKCAVYYVELLHCQLVECQVLCSCKSCLKYALKSTCCCVNTHKQFVLTISLSHMTDMQSTCDMEQTLSPREVNRRKQLI